MRRKIVEAAAQSRLSAVRVVPVEASTGWEHDEEDVERVPRDKSRDYRPGVAVYPPPLPEPPFVLESTPLVMSVGGDTKDSVQQASPSTGMARPSVSAEGYTANETAAIRRFILYAGVLSSNDGVTTIVEIRGFVRGRMR